ncbi:MAG: hypothetical protein FJ271_10125 [Planctomycetes bacterium]|nr:hypothetical protein [Planctomycetota bacterium]
MRPSLVMFFLIPAMADAAPRILVPAYFYPAGQGLKDWDRLLASPARKSLLVIVNPASGPGEKVDVHYTSICKRAVQAQLSLIGYVSTSYAKRPLADVMKDVDRWTQMYPGIQGIFFDEQASSADKVEYYAALYQHVRKKHGLKFVVTNPGTVCVEEYFTRPACDIACLFEGVGLSTGLALPEWTARHAARIFYLAYKVGAGQQMKRFWREADEKNLGYIYITDRDGANPWDSLPSYWDQEEALVKAVTHSTANWTAWRGPDGRGIVAAGDIPLTWDAKKNVRWKVALPAPGNSTPIVWGDKVFLTQALDGGKRRALIAFDRKDGKKLWQREVPCTVVETSHKQNPPCSASPVTDGQAVYAHFFSAGVVAYDFEGKKLWHRDLGPILSRWGNGSSPILYGNLLILFHGPGEPSSFLIALDKRTGKTVWKSDERAINSPVFGSWSTPVIVRSGGRDELIMPLPGERIGGEGMFKAYEPATGKAIWTCRGLGNEIYAMPVVGDEGNLVVGISGHNGPLLAVRPGGNGDVTDSHRAWQQAGKNPQRIGSGVMHQGRLYIADAPGFVACLDAPSGKTIWKERLGEQLWGSLLLANDRLYVTSLEGTTFVLAAGPKFKLLSRNEICEPTYAALAVAGADVFLRTYEHLYCIRKSASSR